MAPAVGTT